MMRNMPWLKRFGRLAHTRMFWDSLWCVGFGVASVGSWMRSSASLDSAVYLLLFALSAYEPLRALVRMRRDRTRHVKAGRLEGTVKDAVAGLSAVFVEDCSSNWERQLVEVKTDGNGRFDLPSTPDGSTHYLRFSLSGLATVLLKVDLVQGRPPMVVRMRPKGS
jgi:hypothetical protein